MRVDRLMVPRKISRGEYDYRVVAQIPPRHRFWGSPTNGSSDHPLCTKKYELVQWWIIVSQCFLAVIRLLSNTFGVLVRVIFRSRNESFKINEIK